MTQPSPDAVLAHQRRVWRTGGGGGVVHAIYAASLAAAWSWHLNDQMIDPPLVINDPFLLPCFDNDV